MGCYSKHCKDLSYCPVTPIPAANLFCGHFCFLSGIKCITIAFIQHGFNWFIIHHYPALLSEEFPLFCEFMGANFWARDFSGSPGYFFCVSIFLPVDYPCHFKCSIPLLGSPTAVILILRGNWTNFICILNYHTNVFLSLYKQLNQLIKITVLSMLHF